MDAQVIAKTASKENSAISAIQVIYNRVIRKILNAVKVSAIIFATSAISISAPNASIHYN